MAELFHVVYSKTVLAKFRRICALAEISGEEQAVLTAGKQIDEALRSDPRGFGDPWYRLPKIQLDVYLRAVPPLLVYYGVHQTKKIVFVRRLEAIANMPG